MTRYIEKEVTEIKIIPEAVVCDRCDRDIKDYEDAIEIRHEFGYGSSMDGNYIEADICETCILEILKNSDVKFRHYENQL